MILSLIKRMHSKYIWDDRPVFCFTSDIDWASEDVMAEYFSVVLELNLKPTLFVTHHSILIEENFKKGFIERGLHPNFMTGSSHGRNFKEVADTCRAFAPEAFGFRSHRAFDVTDITHLMHKEYNFKYVSNQITIFQPNIKPILHESGLINFPVYFEDGTHLYNKLEFNLSNYRNYFLMPGIKVISFHPMNFVFNTPEIKFMRAIKDSLSREDYNNISFEIIKKLRNNRTGIRDTILELVRYVKSSDFPIMSMNELYNHLTQNL